MTTIMINGERAITKSVGLSHLPIKQLVDEEGLPAWQEGERGTWRAIIEELQAWARERRERFSKAPSIKVDSQRETA